MKQTFIILALAIPLTASCGSQPAETAARAATPADSRAPKIALSQLPKIEPQPILDRIKVISADEYEGRAPGTKGEELTVKYIEDEFKKLGLKPGNTDGTYIQKVPLVGITAKPTTSLTVAKGAQKQS